MQYIIQNRFFHLCFYFFYPSALKTHCVKVLKVESQEHFNKHVKNHNFFFCLLVLKCTCMCERERHILVCIHHRIMSRQCSVKALSERPERCSWVAVVTARADEQLSTGVVSPVLYHNSRKSVLCQQTTSDCFSITHKHLYKNAL